VVLEKLKISSKSNSLPTMLFMLDHSDQMQR